MPDKFDINLIDYTESIMPYVRHLHISDAYGNNGEGIQIGEGDIDFENLFQEMKAFDFSWVPEIWSGHLHEGAGVYECLKRLERYQGAL